jgi:histidinol phosphatase-like PHP family hydrolase
MSLQEHILARDFHVHTHLSVCARKDMTLLNIIRRAERLGYRELGISDHLGTYLQPADLRRQRARLARIRTSLRVYLGCETLVTSAGDLAVPATELDFLDYVMVGADHVADDASTPEKDPRLWLRNWDARMERLIASPARIDILAHPLRTLRGYYRSRPLMAHLPARRWRELFAGLARRGTAIELNDTIENGETCYDEIRAVSRIAREEGMKFSLSSDAHGLDRLGFQINWVRLALELGLTARDLWSPSRLNGKPA